VALASEAKRSRPVQEWRSEVGFGSRRPEKKGRDDSNKSIPIATTFDSRLRVL
jgi:hypothetical protein